MEKYLRWPVTSNFLKTLTKRWAEVCAALLFVHLLSFSGGASGKELSYWLRAAHRGEKIATCDGRPNGVPFKIVQNNRSSEFLSSGVILCKDTGEGYTYTLQHLAVLMNKDETYTKKIDFQFFGLSLFSPLGGGETIEWLYDMSLPIAGTLQNPHARKIYFGNISFVVPKSTASQAKRMLFYITDTVNSSGQSFLEDLSVL